MRSSILLTSFLIFLFNARSIDAFAPRPIWTQSLHSRNHQADGNSIPPFPRAESSLTHPALNRQRRSVSNVQTSGLFGLGGPEVAIILVAVAFIIGPQKLGSMLGGMKSGFDDVPDELKKIPEEFQKGIEEGESNARARNAKTMQPPSDKDD